jgi:predicted DNA-binding protein YlxM (UPF0122 family)
MSAKGDFYLSELTKVLGVSRSTVYNKIHKNRSKGFTENEINLIKKQYDLSNEDVFKIFFKENLRGTK